jgi:hypothetical protein
MTVTIALAGKGGTGKTTIAAMFVKYLLANSRGRVLAIDADPSANLNLALGLALEQTIGDIREEMLAQVNPMNGSINGSPGMNKYDYLDYQIEYALVEGERVDLLAMGRPEGPGCYCAVNHILRDIIDRMGRSYDYLVIDNEAGLEHLSRRALRHHRPDRARRRGGNPRRRVTRRTGREHQAGVLDRQPGAGPTDTGVAGCGGQSRPAAGRHHPQRPAGDTDGCRRPGVGRIAGQRHRFQGGQRHCPGDVAGGSDSQSVGFSWMESSHAGSRKDAKAQRAKTDTIRISAFVFTKSRKRAFSWRLCAFA